jgi:FkbM family methyltransferase
MSRVTYLMPIYNEEARIADVLHHAIQWADEVLILNKQSTDRTKSICSEYGPKVRVVEIPFTTQGDDDAIAHCQLASNDWIWVGTASEIPTRKLVIEARRIIAESPDLDLVFVPRKIYSFGCDIPDSPWGIQYYPFLVNRSRAVITNTIHKNFRPKDEKNTARIPFRDDTCVHHFTHASARAYVAAMLQYLEAESKRPEQREIIYESLRILTDRRDLRSLLGSDAFGLECAFRMYWLGSSLYAWEKMRNLDVSSHYKNARLDILRREWAISRPASHGDLRSDHGEQREISDPISNTAISPASTSQKVVAEDQLLYALRGRPICTLINTLYQVGAHRFQEKNLLFEIFPNLQKVVLFEPLPEIYSSTHAQQKGDPRIIVLPYAITDRCGEIELNVASNDGASSSILPLGSHKELFPNVKYLKQVTVPSRTLEAVIREHSLPLPDFLFLDVQGAEYQILSSLSPELLGNLRLIYTEASTVEVYQGAKPLSELQRVLESRFKLIGYAPLNINTPTHGNSLFVSQNDAPRLLPPLPRSISSDASEFQGKEGFAGPRPSPFRHAENQNVRGKVGLIITTFNRESFFFKALASVPMSKLDEVVVVNDGAPYSGTDMGKITIIQHGQNLGVGISKNDGIRHLMARGCDHIFVMEDDMVILDENIFDVYIRAALTTGFGHFNYGPGFGFNRQQAPGLGLAEQHLLDYKSKLLKRLVVKYRGDVSLCFYPNLGGMFAYFSRECIETVGLMDEGFFNVLEHVEHTYRISRTRFHSPFWWFADVDNSERLLESQEGSMAKSSISERTNEPNPEWHRRFSEGTHYFKRKTGYVPGHIPRAAREEVIAFLKSILPRGG